MIEVVDNSEAWKSQMAQIAALGPSGLYDIPGYGEGTIAQLSMYCWLRRMDVDTEQAVTRANAVSAKSRLVKAMTSVLEQLNADGFSEFAPAAVGDYECPRAGGRCTVRDFLLLECGLTEEDLAQGFDGYVKRQAVIDRLQYRIQRELRENEYRQADLQIALNRAETCSSTCSNLIRQFAKPSVNSASQM